MNKPERRRVVAFAAFGWLVGIVLSFRQREDVYSIGITVNWARSRVHE